ncbi:MAG: hypothetical protein V4737_08750 [Curtobacterium sp.]
MTVDTGNIRRWSDAVTSWYESGMTTTTMEVAGKLAPLAVEAAAELDQLRAALAAVPHSTFCLYMTAAYEEPCSCPKSLNVPAIHAPMLRARLNALLILLTDSGDLTPMGVRQIERTLDAERITT